MKYRVCINESLAAFFVDAKSEEEVMQEARQILHDWADQAELEIEEADEQG